MFRKTFLVVLGVSSILLLSALLGTTSRGTDLLLSWATQMARRPSQVQDPPYEAPLQACDVPVVIPGQYFVYLDRGYSLEAHQETIGVDLSPSIRHIFPGTSRHGLYYSANLDDAIVAIVRKDAGVNLVECDRKPTTADFLAVGDL